MTDEPLGSHVLELQVADVVAETDDARCLVFKVPDGAQIPAQRLAYAPGQFLTLRVPSDRTGSVARCYSLCSSPFTDDALTVTVKRTEGGYASNWLCDHAHPGMKLHVLAPSGTFVPPTLDADFLLVAAGSGITPMMSICKSALIEGGGKVVLLYANRDENSVIFGAALRDLGGEVPRPAHRGALAGVRAGVAERGARWPRWPRRMRATTPTSAGPGRSWQPPRPRSRRSACRRSGCTSRCSGRWIPTRSPRS